MNATFDSSVVYKITAVCTSALHCGNNDNDPSEILTDSNGNAFIQGSSIAGAMRGYLDDIRCHSIANRLFGNRNKPGSLYISDGVFENTEITMRPRIRICKDTGSVEHRQKFDVAALPANSVFRFTITWQGFSRHRNLHMSLIKHLLSAMNSGLITIGAQKNNGFGKVRLSADSCTYDMLNNEDLSNWIKDIYVGQPVKLLSIAPKNKTTFTLCGHVDRLLIKSASRETSDGNTVTVNLSEKGRYLIPGSSVKGVIRAQALSIAHFLFHDDLAEKIVTDIFGSDPNVTDKNAASCGHVQFSDMYIDRKAAKTNRFSRIRIDRFTGGVIRKGLFSEEPLNFDFEYTVSLSDVSPKCYALFLYALRDLGLKLCNIGGGSNIGQGFLDIKVIDVASCDGRKGSLKFDCGNCYISDENNLFNSWLSEEGVSPNGNQN